MAMEKPSFRRQAREKPSWMDRVFLVGGIAMLPGGLILLITSVNQLYNGDYTSELNFFGTQTGPEFRAEVGFVFCCLGAMFLWLTLRGRVKGPRRPGRKDEH
jgi:hypothetical protein